MHVLLLRGINIECREIRDKINNVIVSISSIYLKKKENCTKFFLIYIYKKKTNKLFRGL